MVKTKRLRIFWGWVVWLCLSFCLGIAAQQTDKAEIERYSQEAERALGKKNLAKAVVALEKLAQLTPDVAEVHGNLGMVYYTQGRFGEAAAALQRALKLNSRMTNAELMLGICFAELGRNKQAVPILEPAFRDPPDSQIGRLIGLELQRAYAGLQQYGKADGVSDELLNRYPNDAEILYHASRLHGDRALQLMTRLVDVAPNSVWVQLAFAQVHESEKQYDSAITQYRIALRMDPRLPGVHFSLGRALLLNSKTEKSREEALREFEQELAIDPQNSNAEYEIGEIYRQQGQLEQAREHFLRAIQHHPEFEDADIALARILINLKKPREALPHLLAAIDVTPTNEVSHFLLATAYKSLGDSANHEKEMALFQKYHVRPYSAGSGVPEQLPPELATPPITKQTLDSNLPDQP